MYEQMTLWDYQANLSAQQDSIPEEKVIISMDGEVIFYKNYFNLNESDRLFSELYADIKWQQKTIQIFGKRNLLPRLTAWYLSLIHI